MICTYLHREFTIHINKKTISTIVECGSRDCLDSIELVHYYQPEVLYSFECNPESIPVCIENSAEYPTIKVIPKAVSNVDGMVQFFPTNMQEDKDKNIGASSLFLHRNGLAQNQIEVPSIRLDTFMREYNVKSIDLLCMDLQGAEYLAIEGLGGLVKNVKFIISEVSNFHYYYGDMLFNEFTNYLHNRGFQFLTRKGDDALYVSK